MPPGSVSCSGKWARTAARLSPPPMSPADVVGRLGRVVAVLLGDGPVAPDTGAPAWA